MLNILNKKSIGIDIADHTIEVAELGKKGGKPQIVSLGRIKLEAGIVENGRIVDEENLTKAVKDVLAQAKPNSIEADEVIFGLPESQVYTHIFSLEPHSSDERDDLVAQEAKTSIPLKEADLLFSYKILSEDAAKTVVLLVAASKETIKEWQKFWQKLKIKVEFFDLEILANFRGLFPEALKEPVCIVDLGAATTMISVFDKKGLHYSYSFNIAGQAITDLIIKAKNITAEEAEKIKREGLDNLEEELKIAISDKLELITKEIKTALKYVKEQFNIEAKEVVLVGGTSQLKGLIDYFKSNFDLPIRLGEASFAADKRLYIEAIGLALRGLDKKWENDPAIAVVARKSESIETQKQVEDKNFKSGEAGKLRRQKIILLIIGIIGIIAIALAFWYRKIDEAKLVKERQAQMVQFAQTQSFTLQVPVAISPEEYTADRVRGRVIEHAIETAGSYDEAVALAQVKAEEKVKNGEKLWATPISEPEDKENVKFPLVTQWLIYAEQDSNELLLKEVEKLNKNNVDYILNNIEKQAIEQTENPNIFILTGTVKISLDELIEL
jgi:type IV pilus assembly protein PilM